MTMPVVQVRIVRMLMGCRVMGMEMRMPFTIQHCFSIMQMRMMPISVLMIMNMFHHYMGMQMYMRK